VLDEVTFVVVELVVPVDDVCSQIDFLGRPEARLRLLVEVPDVVVLDGEEDKSVGVVFQDGFHHRGILGQHLLDGRLGVVDECVFGGFGGIVHGLVCVSYVV
jgi:hypothetical protein